MKKLLFSSLMGMALVAFTGCAGTYSAAPKCPPGKCGSDEKCDPPKKCDEAKKCASTGK